MAKLEFRDIANGTYRIANGSDGAVYVKVMEAIATNGVALDTNGARRLTYNEADQVETIEIDHGDVDTYRQTFTYTDGNLTEVSAWELVEEE